MRSLRRRLLPKYDFIDYIANPNGGYIDTGIIGSSDLDFEILVLSPPQAIFLFCSRYRRNTEMPTYSYGLLTNTKNSIRFDIGNNLNNISAIDYSAQLRVVKDKDSLNVNGETFNITNSGSSKGSIVLFGVRNVYDGSIVTYDFKLVYMRFLKNGKIIRNFVPCKDKISGKVGLLDNVGGKFYISPNGAEFTGE